MMKTEKQILDEMCDDIEEIAARGITVVKKLVEDATIEEIINDLVYWEDPDQMLQVTPTETGRIWVGDAEWRKGVSASTLKEALISYGKKNSFLMGNPENYDLDWGGYEEVDTQKEAAQA